MTVPQEKISRGQGYEFVSKLEAAGLTPDLAQPVITEPTDSFATEIVAFIAAGPQYTREEVLSTFTYPPEYRLGSIAEQLDAWRAHYPDLDQVWAREYGQLWYDDLVKPAWVEGALVIPDWQAIVPARRTYNDAVIAMIDRLAKMRKVRNFIEGELGPAFLRQAARTIALEKRLRRVQRGPYRIMPMQQGMRHRGRSIRRACVVIRRTDGEAGLGLYHNAAGLVTHTEREQVWDQLHLDCAGDEYTPCGACRVPSKAPLVGFRDDALLVDVAGFVGAYSKFGSSSAFAP